MPALQRVDNSLRLSEPEARVLTNQADRLHFVAGTDRRQHLGWNLGVIRQVPGIRFHSHTAYSVVTAAPIDAPARRRQSGKSNSCRG